MVVFIFGRKQNVGILMMTLDDCKFGSIVNTPKDQHIFYRGKIYALNYYISLFYCIYDTEKQ